MICWVFIWTPFIVISFSFYLMLITSTIAGVGMVILVLATHTLPALKSKLASLKRGFVEKNSKIGDRKQNTIVFTELLLKL